MSNDVAAGRSFSAADQDSFAALSGDRNPMHMCNATARRTQAGACAVHGINLLLWSLEHLARQGFPISKLARAKVRFTSSVYLDRPVSIEVLEADNASLRLQLTTEETPAVTVTLGFAEARPTRREKVQGDLPALAIGAVPREPEFDTMAQQVGRLAFPERAPMAAERLFPTLSQAVGTNAICELALLSTLVGMVSPGLHSIFSELSFSLHQPGVEAPGCAFRVKRADSRFRIVELLAEGASISADVTAYARFPPASPPTMEKAATAVTPGEFRGRHALIIGGSRGIGAATAKLIAAGGGIVTLSYAEGRAEAEAVQADILRHCGVGSCVIFRYQVGADAVAQLGGLVGPFTHTYYFPTPRIFGHSKTVYGREKFLSFVKVYVDGFYDLVMALLDGHAANAPTLFYPSSVAVSERPRHMTEYSMAKAAGEILCADLMRAHPALTITTPRLPRIETDQTATVPPVKAAEACNVMLPLLRQERG